LPCGRGRRECRAIFTSTHAAGLLQEEQHVMHGGKPGLLVLVGHLPAASAFAQSGAPSSLPDWRIGSRLILRLGDESRRAEQFARIVGVLRLPNGQIVVLDGGTQELRLFSGSGEFQRNLTRRGAGPGELQSASWLARSQDSTLVFDRGPQQISVLVLRDGFVTRWRPRASNVAGGITAVGRLTGSLLLVVPGAFRPVEPRAGTIQRDSIRLGILSPGDPGLVRWLGVFANRTWLAYSSPGTPNGLGFSNFPLAPSLVYGAADGCVWLGDSGTDEIQVYDSLGARIHTLAGC
jgi:hypothetical protein